MGNFYTTLYSKPHYLFLAAVLTSIISIKLLLSFCNQIGLVDKPGGRKKHGKNIPLIGGISIFLSVSLLMAPFFLQNTQNISLWIAALLLVLICVMDDIKPIKVNHRFTAQFISITILIIFGRTIIHNLGDLIAIGQIYLGVLSIPFTVFTLIGVINAVNMMDGIDGITGCVSLIELGLMGALAVFIDARLELTLIIVFAGAILAFLLFNFPHKRLKNKIFLGDAGSMLIGLVLAWLTVRLTQGSNKIPPVLMLWIMALPLMDTVHIIFNRRARGLSPFKADRRHIHHILLQLNFSPIQTPLIIMFVSFAIGASGVILYIIGISENILFIGIISIFFTYIKMSIYLKKQVTARKYKSSLSKRDNIISIS